MGPNQHISPETSRMLIAGREPAAFLFGDDGLVPNHPAWPLLIFKGALDLSADPDPAATFEALFARNGWGRGWRNGIYGHVHYHAGIHEVLGIARGHATVRFGGERGEIIGLVAGDVAVLPAGTGHQRLSAARDLLVVGAYPATGWYDERTKPSEHAEAVVAIAAAERPATDPLYGADGPIMRLWPLASV